LLGRGSIEGVAFTLDTSKRRGIHVEKRLTDEIVVWLTTVGPRGTPQPVPVWFLWNGEEIIVCSRPDTPKLRNVSARPRVSLHLNSTRSGGDIVVFTGDATIDETPLSGEDLAAYDAKYASSIRGLGTTNEGFHLDYSVPVRIKPTKLRGF
jgi:PPOX class probable F420-dependent enzyme